MQKLRPLLALTFVATASLATVACSDDVDGGAGGGAGGEGGAASGGGGGAPNGSGVAEWLGADAHLEFEGTVGGKAIDFSVDEGEAADVAIVYCERNYIVPDPDDSSTWGEGYLQKVEVKYNLFYEGKLAEFQLEVEAEALAAGAPRTLTIGDAVASTPQLTLAPDEVDEEQFEDPAVAGTIEFELFDGTPGADGVVVPDGEGKIGFFVDLELESGAKLRGSFTASCGDNDLEAPE